MKFVNLYFGYLRHHHHHKSIKMIVSLLFTLTFILTTIPSTVYGASSLYSQSSNQNDQEKRCEEITVPMCRNIGYNYTSMPNQFHHESQDEAGLEGMFSLLSIIFHLFVVFNNMNYAWVRS